MGRNRSSERVVGIMRRAGWCALLGIILTISAAAVGAQATIKVGEDVSIRFGTLLQGWADWTQDPVSEGYAQNLYLRRVRLLVGGQIAKNITFLDRKSTRLNS